MMICVGKTPVKTGDYLVRDRIVYPPQRPKHPIESSKLHPGCEIVHLIWSARLYGAQTRTQIWNAYSVLG